VALTDKKAAQLRRVRELADRLGVEILAHFFQREEIKAAADFVGGAYEVTDRAVSSLAPAVLVCGAVFMHEAIRARRPAAELLIPRGDISCPLAATVSLEDVQAAKRLYPEALIVADLKATPAIRALAEVEISPETVRAKLSAHPGAVFIALPGPQLLDLAGFGERVVARWPQAVCQVHELAQAEDLARARAEHPGALAAAHFLCRPELLARADFVTLHTPLT
jgi:quinolinate synthase